MDFDFKIQGFKEMDQLLNLLPEQVARKLADNAVRAGGNLLAKKVDEKAPGSIKGEIVVKKDKKSQHSVGYKIGVSKKVHIAHLIEFGTAPHKIATGKKSKRKKRNKKVLSDGSKFFGNEINHPGTKAEPFFRPALEENQAEYLKKVGQILARGLAREAARFTGRYKRR